MQCKAWLRRMLARCAFNRNHLFLLINYPPQNTRLHVRQVKSLRRNRYYADAMRSGVSNPFKHRARAGISRQTAARHCARRAGRRHGYFVAHTEPQADSGVRAKHCG